MELKDEVTQIGVQKDLMKEKIRKDIFNLDKRFKELQSVAYTSNLSTTERKINYNIDIMKLPSLNGPVKLKKSIPEEEFDCDLKYRVMQKLTDLTAIAPNMAHCISLARMNLQVEKDLLNQNIQDLIEDKKNSLGLYYRYIRNLEELFKKDEEIDRKGKEFKAYFCEKLMNYREMRIPNDKTRKLILD